MIYQGKNITLKNGTAALLRAPSPADAAGVLQFLQNACGESDYLARYAEELRFTVQSEAAYLKATLDNPDGMMIVCDVDGEIAGNCEIIFMNTRKTRHRAAVMIGLQQKYWGLGIGSAMLGELIAEARRRGTEQVELEMIEGNERAMALYRKMGFSVMAEHPDAFILKDGSRRSAIFMRLVL